MKRSGIKRTKPMARGKGGSLKRTGKLKPAGAAKAKKLVRYGVYMRSKAWRTRRLERLALDGNRCTRCGLDQQLTVHHLSYLRFGNENLEDLATLCAPCHKAEEKKLRPWNKRGAGWSGMR